MSIKPEKLVVARNLAKELNETMLDDCCDFPHLVHANAHLASTIIERLCFEIEQLEAAQPKWISVEDELPPVGERVLACIVKHHICEAFIDCEDMWHRSPNCYELKGTVTHWMPLPEPPEEEV
jgi:hypothetical protein